MKAMVPRKYPPFTAAGLVLFEADYISDLYGVATFVGNPSRRTKRHCRTDTAATHVGTRGLMPPYGLAS